MAKLNIKYDGVDPEALLQLAIRLAQAKDRQQLFDEVAGFTNQFVGVVRASIVLRGDDPTVYEMRSLAGVLGRLLDNSMLPIEGTGAGRCIQTGVTQRWRTDQQNGPDAVVLRTMGIRHVINVPIANGSKRYGSINTNYADDDLDEMVSDAHVAVLEPLGRLLASQIERVDTRQQLEAEIEARRRQNNRLRLLHTLDNRLSHATTIQALISGIDTVLTEAVRLQWLSFIHLDGPDDTATLYSSTSVAGLPSGSTLPVDNELLRSLFETTMVHYRPDINEPAYEHNPRNQMLIAAGIRAILHVSVFSHDKLVGLLNFGSDQLDGVDDDDQTLFVAVASFLGSALERVAAIQQLEYKANHDQLTGLLHRERFEEQLAIELADDNNKRPLAVAFIDTDHFKAVNDTDGHHTGDLMLTELAHRLRSVTRSTDMLARVGGDEFLLLLRDRSYDDFVAVGQAIVDVVSDQPFGGGAATIRGTVSVGMHFLDNSVDSFTQSEITPVREVIAHADAACRDAKALGGNRIHLANTNDHDGFGRRTSGSLLRTLRRAVNEGALVLYGQNLIDLEAGCQPTATEVLVRMIDDDGSLIPPARFIPIAERYGAIQELDYWVTANAVAAIASMVPPSTEWHGTPVLYINLSATSVTDETFLARIVDIFDQTNLPPAAVCFEITETGTMRSFDSAMWFIRTVGGIGARVALDDFGVGLSSLSHLQQLPIDVLKIDGTLISGIEDNRLNQTMVTAIKAIADELGITTVAEFVATDAALQHITAIGIDYGQGFLFDRPRPLKGVLDELSQLDHRYNLVK